MRQVVALSPAERERKAASNRCYVGELSKLEATYGACADPAALHYELFWRPGNKA